MRQHLLLGDTANGSVGLIHTDILDIVQLAEDTQLGELGDTGQENKLQVRVASLQGAVKVTHDITQDIQILLLVHHIEQRSIVFVYKNHHLAASLFISALDKPGQPQIGIAIRCIETECALIVGKHKVKQTFQAFLIHMLRHTHIEMKHRILRPLRLQPLHSQTTEQLLAPREITMQRGSKQRLTETPRTAQEHITGSRMRHLINIFRLIYIKIIFLTDFKKCLYTYRVSSLQRFHINHIFYKATKKYPFKRPQAGKSFPPASSSLFEQLRRYKRYSRYIQHFFHTRARVIKVLRKKDFRTKRFPPTTSTTISSPDGMPTGISSSNNWEKNLPARSCSNRQLSWELKRIHPSPG